MRTQLYLSTTDGGRYVTYVKNIEHDIIPAHKVPDAPEGCKFIVITKDGQRLYTTHRVTVQYDTSDGQYSRDNTLDLDLFDMKVLDMKLPRSTHFDIYSNILYFNNKEYDIEWDSNKQSLDIQGKTQVPSQLYPALVNLYLDTVMDETILKGVRDGEFA